MLQPDQRPEEYQSAGGRRGGVRLQILNFGLWTRRIEGEELE